MSKYTTEVRFICEDAAGLSESAGFNAIEDKLVEVNPGETVLEKGILSKAAEKIFDFPYPIFDEAYRLPLEKKILRHYYTREICEETVGLWKLRLSDRLNIIMPYYNQMYESELIKFNPLYDVDLSRTHTGERGSEEDKTTSTTNTSIASGDKTIDTQAENISRNNSITDRTSHEDTENTGDTTNANSQSAHTVREDKNNGSSTNISQNEQTNDINRTEKNDSSTSSNRKTTDIISGNTTTNEISNNNDTSERWDKYSETPQGEITGLANDEYLTNARNIKDTKGNFTSGHGDSTVDQTTDSTEGGVEVSSGGATITEGNSSKSATSQVGSASNESKGNETTTGSGTTVGHIKEVGSNTNTEKTINFGENSETGKSKNTETNNNIRTDNGNLTGKNTITGTESYTEFVLGKQGSGSYSRMLMEFRETFMNIDAMIIEELSDLFFGLW